MQSATFEIGTDCAAIKLGELYDDPKSAFHGRREPLFRAALEELTKAGILYVLSSTTYGLTAPIGSFVQQVSITPYTAAMVADAFNTFARNVNGMPYVANKLSITDTEIQALVQIVFGLHEKLEEVYEQMANMDEEADDPGLGGSDPYGFQT